ncbi:MAG: site-specific integrase [Clostridia bacterium]
MSFVKEKSKYTYFSWLDEWIKIYKKPLYMIDGKISNGLRNILNCIKNHIKTNMIDVNLSDITALQIQETLSKITSTRTKKYVFDVFHESLKKALSLELIEKDIMLNVDKPRHKRKIGNSLSSSELVKFLKIIKGNSMEKLYKFYLLTGVRKSEALSIDKKIDIDNKNNTIHIIGTKTECSNRIIPMFKETKLLIQSIDVKGKYLFPFTANAVACNFKRLQKTNNLKFTIHSLRHTFASNCIENGICMKTIQKWLGHSKLDTTANIYLHISNEFEKKEIDKFKVIFSL